jgi:excisionase family DNA binding protein
MSLTDLEAQPFITTREAARMLGVSIRTVQLWVESGVLSAWKTAGGHRRVARASVEELQSQQRDVIETATGLKLPKILLVESDPVHLELYRMKIANWRLPVAVITAQDGFEALMAVGESKPQLVVTEVELPGMNGIQLVRALRERAADVEVIVATGLDDEAIDRAGGLPKDVPVLKKPIQFDMLHNLVLGKLGIQQPERLRDSA